MMSKQLGHGGRLTDAQYEERIVRLHEGLPPMPSEEQDRQTRRQALDLAIDHRLGLAFPAERREALWAIRERVEKKRLRLGLRVLVARLFPKQRGSNARNADALTRFVVDKYAEVLTPDELKSFLGLREGDRVGLPIGSRPDEEQD